jgi:hypothetical protein
MSLTDSVSTAGQRNSAENIKSPQNSIILTEPVSLLDGVDPQPSQIEINRFLANDLVLSKALANSAFGRAGISSVVKNNARNLLVLIMKTPEDISLLLEVKELGLWKIKCRLLVCHTTSVGIIGPFG